MQYIISLPLSVYTLYSIHLPPLSFSLSLPLPLSPTLPLSPPSLPPSPTLSFRCSILVRELYHDWCCCSSMFLPPAENSRTGWWNRRYEWRPSADQQRPQWEYNILVQWNPFNPDIYYWAKRSVLISEVSYKVHKRGTWRGRRCPV